MILHGLCYSAGNSEPGRAWPSVEAARERIQNFAAGYLAVGAKAVFAEPYGDVGYILSAIFTSKSTARQIFMGHDPAPIASYIAYPSHRTVGAHLIGQLEFEETPAAIADREPGPGDQRPALTRVQRPNRRPSLTLSPGAVPCPRRTAEPAAWATAQSGWARARAGRPSR